MLDNNDDDDDDDQHHHFHDDEEFEMNFYFTLEKQLCALYCND